jgi:hypothetical protein
MKKIAIYVNGGMVEAVRSNIGEDIDVEIIDGDSYRIFNVKSWEGNGSAENRWKEIKEELSFGNY